MRTTSKSNRTRSIRGRVMVLVGTGLAATMALMGYLAWRTQRDLAQEVVRQRETMVHALAAELDDRIERLLAQLYGVGISLRGQMSEAPAPEAMTTAEILRSAFLSLDEFDAMVVADADGAIRGIAPAGAEVAPAVRALAGVVREQDRPVVRLLDSSPGHAERQVWAAVPVKNWTGAYAGFVAGFVEIGSRRFETLTLPIVKGRLGATDLLDDAGAVIAVSGNRQQHLASHGRGGAEARCSTTGWRVVIHEMPNGATGPSLLTSWLVATPLLAALALLFSWGAAQSVRRPLATLTDAAERIAAGDLAQPIPRLPADEVGRLGRAFERMRASLSESLARIAADNVELEERVDARTRELARLNEELREREQTRLQLLRKVIRAQEDERKRIARELHDETGQTLTALALRLDLAQVAAAGERAEQPVADARALARRSLEELHRLMHDLRPSVLDDLGLVAALRWLTEHRLAPKGISVSFEEGDVPDRLPPEVETALFRAAQEALTNVERHAKAEHVLVQVGQQKRRLVIEIEDDGEGFDPGSVTPQPGSARGLGLLGMRERVELFGGSITFDSTPGSGTRVVIEVPVQALFTP